MSLAMAYNGKVLCAVGDFGNGTFNLPQKPDRSTNVQLTTSAPIAQNTCCAYVAVNLGYALIGNENRNKKKKKRWQKTYLGTK